MTKVQTILNQSLTEDTAGTIKYAAVEVPGSAGATRVIMFDAQTVASIADVKSTQTWSASLIQIGNQVPTTPTLAMTGAVAYYALIVQGDSSSPSVPMVTALTSDGHMYQPVEVPRDTSGKFYITIAVYGAGNTNKMSGAFACKFVVEY